MCRRIRSRRANLQQNPHAKLTLVDSDPTRVEVGNRVELVLDGDGVPGFVVPRFRLQSLTP
jgi:hypothetical protein